MSFTDIVFQELQDEIDEAINPENLGTKEAIEVLDRLGSYVDSVLDALREEEGGS